MSSPYLDAKAFDNFLRSNSEASTSASTSAYSNTSGSTAHTPASTISSPGGHASPLVKYEDHDGTERPEVDTKPVLTSLDTLLRTTSTTASGTGGGGTDHSEGVASNTRPSVKAIVIHLEDIVRTFIDLINSRALTPTHPITQSFDPKFSATTPAPWPQGVENLSQYLHRLVSLAAQTEYKMIVQGLDTHVYKNGHAGVFVTSDVVGVPPGVLRHIVAVFRFRKREGVWRCFTVEEVMGIENTAGGEPGSGGGGRGGGGFAGPF